MTFLTAIMYAILGGAILGICGIAGHAWLAHIRETYGSTLTAEERARSILSTTC